MEKEKSNCRKNAKTRRQQNELKNEVKEVRYTQGELRDGPVFFIFLITSYHKLSDTTTYLFLTVLCVGQKLNESHWNK